MSVFPSSLQDSPFVSTLALQAGDTVGRFVLQKHLDDGAQSSVWLALEPQTQREVLVKMMRVELGTEDGAVAQWLQQVRAAGRVLHPNIVPLLDADLHGRQPYVVFEHVVGQTLDELLRERGAVPPIDAVTLMVAVLDALVVVHQAGLVHGDLKPSNIIVSKSGQCRLINLGLASRISGKRNAETLNYAGGAPGYLSPEATQGAPAAPAMEIYSVGLVLAELLIGKPLVNEPDSNRVLSRVGQEHLSLPAGLSPLVDDWLRAIVSRALAKDPLQRFSSALAMRAEMQAWVKPPVGDVGTAGEGLSGTVELLLQRMRQKGDFPALSDAVVRIQSMAASETESVNSVTNAILKDVALTNKILRLVNSAQYAHFSQGGKISTVSRAVMLLGFNGIRNMALSLVILERMQDKAHAAQLKEEFLRCLMAGNIGAELCPQLLDSEESFLGAMFQNLGRLLAQFYFPEETAQVLRLMQSTSEPLSEAAAAITVLGLTFEDLGLGIAKSWGLPSSIQRCMHKALGTPPSITPLDAVERIRWISLAANEIADALLHCTPQELDARITQICRKYSQAMGIGSREVLAATNKARQKMRDLALAMDVRVPAGSPAARLLRVPVEPNAAVPLAADMARTAVGGLGGLELQATPMDEHSVSHRRVQSGLVASVLTAGIQDVTNAMVDDFKLADVLRMILETMLRALEFDRIIFCMRDVKTDTITGRFGLGQGVEQYVKLFKIQLKVASPDLFATVCAKGADTMVADAGEAHIASRLPEWFRKGVNAPTFLLLPLQIKGSPFGLIYADKIRRVGLEMDDKELSLLRTLRNQAVMAFKQSA